MTNSRIPFSKMNALGNDFIIIDQRQKKFDLAAKDIIWLANRKIVGCDQLIVILNDETNQANCYIEIYNADGSKSAACGNATRCVAGLLFAENNCQRVKIKTDAGVLECCLDGDLVLVAMSCPKFLWSEIPASKDVATDLVFFASRRFYLVNVGNPHAVTFLDGELSDQEFFALGKMIESDPLFPLKTNVEFARIIGDELIEVRVFERGVGETLACGSGACGVAAVAMKYGLIKQRQVTIRFKGGDIKIKWLDDNSTIMMSGTYQHLFNAVIEI